MLTNRPTQRQGPRTCPLCREQLEGAVRECQGCLTSYHASCMSELGGCATLGCGERGSGLQAGPRVKSTPGRAATLCVECDERVMGHDDGGICRCEAWVHHRCRQLHPCRPRQREAPAGTDLAGEERLDRYWFRLTHVALPIAWVVALLGGGLVHEFLGLVVVPPLLLLMIEVRHLAVTRLRDGDRTGALAAWLGWPLCGVPVVGALLYDRAIRQSRRRRPR